MKKTFLSIFLMVNAFLFLTLTPAQSARIGFYCITNESPDNATTGEAQFFMDLTDPVGSQVMFTFTNIGPNSSSITDVYFDDGSLLSIASIDNSSDGVSFSQYATPGDLPGGNEIDPHFVTTAGFSADSDPAVQPNGVNNTNNLPGEYLGILFDLEGSHNFADVLDELASAQLRVGIKAQGFADGGSESFVNIPIPIPSAALLLGSGILILARFKRKVRSL